MIAPQADELRTFVAAETRRKARMFYRMSEALTGYALDARIPVRSALHPARGA
jgi:hypothetical protein